MKAGHPSVIRVAVPCHLRTLLDYFTPENHISDIAIGARVLVPFRKSTVVGFILACTDKPLCPNEKIKTALAILDESSCLPQDLIKLCEFASEYYHYPIGEVFAAATPKLLRDPNKTTSLIGLAEKYAPLTPQHTASQATPPTSTALTPNTEQTEAIQQIIRSSNTFKTFLLAGITGSGKTEVYLQCIQHHLMLGQQVLVLLPEINLTPQTLQRFSERFTVPIHILHSRLTPKQKMSVWLKNQQASPQILIGTRSALFMPFQQLGLIVIDEEHDLSFKQQDGFHYSARDLAIYRAQHLQIPIILGSATPSLESLWHAQQGRYQRLDLRSRPGETRLPEMIIMDLNQHKQDHGIAYQTLKYIRESLAKKEQVMIFLNRRGFAPALYCTSCQWIANCNRCLSPYTIHQHPNHLICHHCDRSIPVPNACPHCKQPALLPLGCGTERIEEGLKIHFPDFPILRIDRDTTRKKGSLETFLAKIHSDEPQILVGTQMIAKGHHFPRVTLVVIVDADSGLFTTDFLATERFSQLFTQIAGRAGRGDLSGKVIVQTRFPEHPTLQSILREGYEAFAKTLLITRRQSALPPFEYFALVRAESVTKQAAQQFLGELKEKLSPLEQPVSLLGPIPAPMEMRQGKHRAQLLIQAKQRGQLHRVLRLFLKHLEESPLKNRVRWSIDVDPKEMF